MASKIVCCCGANTWSLVIGWLQTIFSALDFLYILGATIYKIYNLHHEIHDPDERYRIWTRNVMLSVLACIDLMILFAAGIVLIKGVKNGNAKYLKAWMVIEIASATLAVLGFIITIAVDEFFLVLIQAIIFAVLSLFCIWVVSIHRKELLKQRQINSLPVVGA